MKRLSKEPANFTWKKCYWAPLLNPTKIERAISLSLSMKICLIFLIQKKNKECLLFLSSIALFIVCGLSLSLSLNKAQNTWWLQRHSHKFIWVEWKKQKMMQSWGPITDIGNIISHLYFTNQTLSFKEQLIWHSQETHTWHTLPWIRSIQVIRYSSQFKI